VVERGVRPAELLGLVDCSFGRGKCVWKDDEEARRRCPRARAGGDGGKAEAAPAPERSTASAADGDWY